MFMLLGSLIPSVRNFRSVLQGWEQSAILNQEKIVNWLQNGEKQLLNHLLKA